MRRMPILPGGVVVPLYPPGSPFLKTDRVREAEQYNMSQAVPGRIGSIVNIHNPSIEVHTGRSQPEYRRGRDPGGGRRAQHSERRRRGRRLSFPFSTTTASTRSSCAIGCAATATTRRPTQ